MSLLSNLRQRPAFIISFSQVADAFDVHCEYYHHFTPEPTQHRDQTRFLSKGTLPFRLAFLQLVVEIEPCLVYGSRRFFGN